MKYGILCGLTAVDPEHYDGWDGACPGADVDLCAMQSLLVKRGYNVASVYNALANRYTLRDVYRSVCSDLRRDDTLLLYYSGHGGQVQDTSGDEPDELDETLCLWDGETVDDVIGDLLTMIPAGVDVVIVTDCCHAESNIRATRRMNLISARQTFVRRETIRCNVLHFAGCTDDSYSYGDETGGAFTQTLLSTLGTRKTTYYQWFKRAAKAMPSYQKPVMNEIGVSFGSKPALG